MLHRIIYTSAVSPAFVARDLRDILETARRNNAKARVTGLLVVHDLAFLQVLEGAKADVTRIYEAISKDPRHQNVRILESGDVEARVFPHWRMGFSQSTDLPETVRDSVFSILELASSNRSQHGDEDRLRVVRQELLANLSQLIPATAAEADRRLG